MNFLAHFHLAWPNDELIAGGLEGDYLKGPLKGHLPRGIEQGVQLHRAIDGYTDRHPVVEALRRDFPPELRRFAGILIDLCFDHYLSLHWSRFEEQDLAAFNSGVYRSLQLQQEHLSLSARKMLSRLVEHDILGIYHQWDTVPASAARIGERFRRDNPFRDVNGQLQDRRAQLEEGFLSFYPDLQQFVCEHRQNLN